VGVGVCKERFNSGFTQGVVVAGDDLVEIDKSYMLLLRHLLRPATIVIGIANDLAIFHILRGIGEQTIGVAPFAIVSATYLRMYQP
jgi:hypothetical protein